GQYTFNLPDLRGRVPVGVDELEVNAAGMNRSGAIGGRTMHRLTIDQIPSHNHSAGSLSTSSNGTHSHIVRDDGHNHGGRTGSEPKLGTGRWGMTPKGYGSEC
ncbi:unnamed protein product, partial [Rotaria sp. Silwood2]